MASTGSDDGIPRSIEATETLRDGRFGIRVPEAGSADQVARLGTALNDLSSALERRWREVAEVDAIAARINAGHHLDDVLEDFFREALDIFPYDRIGFSLLENGGTVVRARWARSDVGPLRLGKGYAARLEGSSLQSILETGRPRIINDLVADLESNPSSESTRLVVEEGVRSSLTCPLVANGMPVGFMFFSSRHPDTYRDAHVDAYRKIAGQLSVIVGKGRLISELSEQKAALGARGDDRRDRGRGLPRPAPDGPRRRSPARHALSAPRRQRPRVPPSGSAAEEDLVRVYDLQRMATSSNRSAPRSSRRSSRPARRSGYRSFRFRPAEQAPGPPVRPLWVSLSSAHRTARPTSRENEGTGIDGARTSRPTA